MAKTKAEKIAAIELQPPHTGRIDRTATRKKCRLYGSAGRGRRGRTGRYRKAVMPWTHDRYAM